MKNTLKIIFTILRNKNLRWDIIFVVSCLLYMVATMGNKAEATIQASEQYLNMEFNPEVPNTTWVIPIDLDRLAKAVARHETASCTKGYGPAPYNNCFGIKNGTTAPCKKIGNNRMCMYDNPKESFEAFKIIWSKVYGGKMPTIEMARKYSGNHNPSNWVYNVNQFYNE